MRTRSVASMTKITACLELRLPLVEASFRNRTVEGRYELDENRLGTHPSCRTSIGASAGCCVRFCGGGPSNILKSVKVISNWFELIIIDNNDEGKHVAVATVNIISEHKGMASTVQKKRATHELAVGCSSVLQSNRGRASFSHRRKENF
jgi:hypothetical protein